MFVWCQDHGPFTVSAVARCRLFLHLAGAACACDSVRMCSLKNLNLRWGLSGSERSIQRPSPLVVGSSPHFEAYQQGHLSNPYCHRYAVQHVAGLISVCSFPFFLWAGLWPLKLVLAAGRHLPAREALFARLAWKTLTLRTLGHLTAFKSAPNPKLVQNLSRRLFFRVPFGKTWLCQEYVQPLKNDHCQANFDKFWASSSPPEWNPEKQSSGQILHKFGVREGSQEPLTSTVCKLGAL